MRNLLNASKAIFIFVLCCVNCFGTIAYAAANPGLVSASQQLALEQERNDIVRQQVEQLEKTQALKIKKLQPNQVDSSLLRHAGLDTNTAQLDLTSATLAISETQQTIENVSMKLRDLQAQLHEINFSNSAEQAQQQLQDLQTGIKNQQELLKVVNKRLKILQETQIYMQRRVELQQDWESALRSMYETNQAVKRQLSLDQLAGQLQQQQQQGLVKLAALNLQAKTLIDKGLTNSATYNKLVIAIFAAEEQINLSHLQLITAQLSDQIENFNMSGTDINSVTYLRTAIQEADASTEEIKQLRELVEGKLTLIKQRINLETDSHSNDDLANFKLTTFNGLSRAYQDQLDTLINLQTILTSRVETLSNDLRRALASRQGLPGFVMRDWVALGKEIVHLGSITLQTISGLWQQVINCLQQLSGWRLALLLAIELILLKAWHKLRSYLLTRNQGMQLAGQSLTVKAWWVSLELVRRNLFALTVLLGLTIILNFCDLNAHTNTLVLPLAITWFSFRSALILARLSLLENMTHEEGHDVRLYRGLRWMLVFGGLVTAFTVLSYELPVAYDVQNFFNRLLTIFVLLIAVLLFKSRHVFPALLEPYLANGRPYLRRSINLLVFLIPITIFADALLGLVGYIELAWTISKYAGLLLLVLALFVIANGFLKDLMEIVARFCIRNLRNGWLWSEAVLKPFHGLLSIGLFILSGVLLFALYGWGPHSFMARQVVKAIHFKLFTLGGNGFTLLTLVKLFVIGFILYWLGRWSREFAYRWLYARTKNQGLRNSLAVFTQYIAVLMGIFLALRVIGIDLSSLALVLSSFAVAVGLGLRDFANSFVSGMWLLVERPIRKGDYVTVDEHEGYIASIGTRATTIITGDNNEVIVPNAQVFSKSFINWTYQDTVVRITIPINVSIHTNPELVQTAILDLLKDTPGVVSKPSAEVFLKNMIDGLMQFEVRYYIDLKVTDSRSEMRSRVLFAIYALFKELHIKTPHPEQDIYVKELPKSIT